jgi:hypothetical protein
MTGIKRNLEHKINRQLALFPVVMLISQSIHLTGVEFNKDTKDAKEKHPKNTDHQHIDFDPDRM